MENKKDDNTEGCATLISIILLIIFDGTIDFALGYFGGWLLKIIIGDWVVACFNIAFKTNYFCKDMLPAICATLSFIGGYFKSSANKNTLKSKS